MSDEPVRLHIGCGQNILPGYTNIDGYVGKDRAEHFQTEPDLVCDALDIDQHFKPESVDEIRCEHMIEHVSLLDFSSMLISWNRAMKQKALLRLVTPDFTESAIRAICCPDPEIAEIYFRNIFGSQQGQGEIHQSTFTLARLNFYLVTHGFTITAYRMYEVQHSVLPHIFDYKGNMPLHNMAVEADKTGPPNLEWIEANQTTPFSYRRKCPREGK